jgi:hypothetical protein
MKTGRQQLKLFIHIPLLSKTNTILKTLLYIFEGSSRLYVFPLAPNNFETTDRLFTKIDVNNNTNMIAK